MVGVEFDFIVKDSLAALEQYEKIFEVERVEVTSFDRGMNEVVFNIYGTRFHMLDENPEYNLFAPTGDKPNPFWVNVLVPDIKETYKKAMDAGCKEIQAIVEMPDFGVANAIFADSFGYAWMLHEIHEVVSFEDRVKHFEEEIEKQNKE